MSMAKVAIGLMRYYDITRQVGHTMAMLNGAKNTTDVVIIAHNMSHATDLAKQCLSATPVGLGNIERKLRGRKAPLLIDNSAMAEILGGLLKEISDLRSDLRKAASEQGFLQTTNDYLQSECMKKLKER